MGIHLDSKSYTEILVGDAASIMVMNHDRNLWTYRYIPEWVRKLLSAYTRRRGTQFV